MYFPISSCMYTEIVVGLIQRISSSKFYQQILSFLFSFIFLFEQFSCINTKFHLRNYVSAARERCVYWLFAYYLILISLYLNFIIVSSLTFSVNHTICKCFQSVSYSSSSSPACILTHNLHFNSPLRICNTIYTLFQPPRINIQMVLF